MARIYLSPLIVDIRNKQSDTVFSKWKGINYIRSRVVPHNPKSAAQVAIRDALSELVSLWQDSLAGVKLNWDEYASGRDYSGFNKWIGKNVISERDSVLLNITQEVGFTKMLTLAAAPGAAQGEVEITWTPTPIAAGEEMSIHIREAGASEWEVKTSLAAAVASPQDIGGITPNTLVEIYCYLGKAAAPTGEEIGKDLSDTATSTA